MAVVGGAHAQSASTAATSPAADVQPDQATHAGQLEEIVVTAQKRSQNLQDVPVAVSAVTAQQLEHAGVDDIVDLRLAVPALNVTYTNGYITSSLRGVGSNGVGPGIENPVALYLDGVYIASQSASLLTLNNIADIEVLKGPQGTLFGRNATGGLIQVTTRNPMDDQTSSVELRYGNYNTVTAGAYLAEKFSDILAADVALRYSHQGDGYGKNLATGQNVYQVDHDVSVRSKWVLDPVEGTRLTLVLDYSDVRDSLSGFVRYPGTTNGYATLPNYPPALPNPTTGYDVASDFNPLHDQWNSGVSLRWDQDIADLKFSSITAFRESLTDFDFDYDETSQPVETLLVLQRDEQFSQEFQIGSGPGGRLNWIAGLYDFSSRSAYDPAAFLLNDAGVNINIRNKVTAQSMAGYGQATYEIVPATNLTLGVRYTSEERKSEDGTTDVFVVAPALALPPAVADDRSARFNKFTYRVSLDHRFSDQVLGYVSENTGFKSGGFNAGSPGSNPFTPETIQASEIGVKTDWFGRRVRLNAAGFYYDYKNIQIQHLGDAGIISIINGADAHVYGGDLDATVLITQNLRLVSGISAVSAKFTSFPACPFSSPAGGVPVVPSSCKGNQLPLASKLLSNIGLDYGMDLAGGKLNLNGSAYFNNGFYPESDNVIKQPAFWQFGTYVAWTAPDGHFTVGAYGKNLNNERVIAYETTPANGTHQVIWAAPRTYGINLGYKF